MTNEESSETPATVSPLDTPVVNRDVYTQMGSMVYRNGIYIGSFIQFEYARDYVEEKMGRG